MQLRVCDEDGFAWNTDSTLVAIIISRADVEAGRYASTLSRLHCLTDSIEAIDLYEQSVALLVEGYDDDPRQLWEVEEVRRFMGALSAQWPHFYWFWNVKIQGMSMILACLSDVETIRGDGDAVGVMFKSPPDVARKAFELVRRSAASLHNAGVADERLLAMLARAEEDICKMFGLTGSPRD